MIGAKPSKSDEPGSLKMIEGGNIVNRTNGFAKNVRWGEIVNQTTGFARNDLVVRRSNSDGPVSLKIIEA